MSTGARAAEESLSICMRVAKAQNYPDTSCPTLPLRLRGRCSQPTDESATDENGGNQRAQLVDAVAVGGCAWWVPQPPARACPQAPHCPTPAPTASKRAGTLHWERRRRPPAGTVASTLRSSLACPRRQSRRCDRDKNDCRRRRRGGRNSRRYHHHHHLCPGVSRPPPPPSTGRCVHACRALRPARRRRPPTPPTAIHLRPPAPPAHSARATQIRPPAPPAATQQRSTRPALYRGHLHGHQKRWRGGGRQRGDGAAEGAGGGERRPVERDGGVWRRWGGPNRVRITVLTWASA